MFKNTKTQIGTTVADIKAAFALLINTIKALTRAVSDNTAEQSQLRAKLDTIATHAQFLAEQKRAELTRAGHRV